MPVQGVTPKQLSYITKITHTKILYKTNTHNTKRQSIPQHAFKFGIHTKYYIQNGEKMIGQQTEKL